MKSNACRKKASRIIFPIIFAETVKERRRNRDERSPNHPYPPSSAFGHIFSAYTVRFCYNGRGKGKAVDSFECLFPLHSRRPEFMIGELSITDRMVLVWEHFKRHARGHDRLHSSKCILGSIKSIRKENFMHLELTFVKCYRITDSDTASVYNQISFSAYSFTRVKRRNTPRNLSARRPVSVWNILIPRNIALIPATFLVLNVLRYRKTTV